MTLLRVTLVAGGVALGIGSAWVGHRPGALAATAADLAVGWALLGCGLLAWDRRGRDRFGLLMVASGAAWFLGSFVPAALYLHRGPLVHALLSYPDGRLRGRLNQLVVAAAYVDGAIAPLARSPIVTLMLCAAIAVAALDGYLRALGPRRRARAAATAGALALALMLGFGAGARLAGSNVDAEVLWAYELVLLLVAIGLLGDLLRGRWSQGAVTGLVVDLGEQREPATLRDRLARALGDSSLQLGWWLGRSADTSTRPGGRCLTPGRTAWSRRSRASAGGSAC